MTTSMKVALDSELHIYRIQNGIKLIRPSKQQNLNIGYETAQTIGSILQLPCSVYFEDTEGIIQALNDVNVQYCGFDSVSNAIGKKYFTSFTKSSIMVTRRNDLAVMKQNRIQIIAEEIVLKNEKPSKSLSIKMPWYNNDNKLIGLFGCTIELKQNTLAYCLSEITKLNLVNMDKTLGSTFSMKLSKRQMQCAQLLLQGKTSKEIANDLNLSCRTIEHYIDAIKNKLHCQNKTELVLKLSKLRNKLT